jgi:hypothetical protein
MERDRNGLEILDREECLHLLEEATIGRLAFTSRAMPVILPVNFYLDGDRVLIRTSPGSKLDAAIADAVVAFEVDDFDSFQHTGWSVSVTGYSRVVTDPDEVARVNELPIAHWAPNGGDNVVSMSLDVVTGRRIVQSLIIDHTGSIAHSGSRGTSHSSMVPVDMVPVDVVP